MQNCSMFPEGKGVKNNISRCPECGLPNKCGLNAGKGTCWCYAMPRLDMERGDTDQCYCKTCLQKKIDEVS